ncbi:MAG: cytidine deaminase [Sphingomonadales bacterium]|nr:cytidine deaminase [Sphingomonadales bacterium]
MTNDLLKAAQNARQNAYAPYSNFQVGAAIRTDDGQIYAGSNVENAAYPESQCAEATAIGHMISNGGRAIEEVLIIGPSSDNIVPCGGCRQRLMEFANADTKIHCADKDGRIKTHTLGSLLPHAFGPNSLTSKDD